VVPLMCSNDVQCTVELIVVFFFVRLVSKIIPNSDYVLP